MEKCFASNTIEYRLPTDTNTASPVEIPPTYRVLTVQYSVHHIHTTLLLLRPPIKNYTHISPSPASYFKGIWRITSTYISFPSRSVGRENVGNILVRRRWGAKEEGCAKKSDSRSEAAVGHVTEERTAFRESDGEAG